LQRGANLERAGYDVQVKVTAKSTLLFTMRDGVRQPVAASNSHFKSGDATWTRDEALRLVDASPENVQRECVVPAGGAGLSFARRWRTLAGRRRVAYYAQSSVIYEHLLGRMPVILPRAGFTILDAKAEKLFAEVRPLYRESLGRPAGAAAEAGIGFGADGAVREFRS